MPSLAHPPTWRLALAGLGLALASLLGGCASVIRLDHDVRSYAQWPAAERPAAGDRFRFERLPSQQTHAQAQGRLESLVAERLGAWGLVPEPQGTESAKWSVEVSARAQRLPHAPWESPFDPWPGPGLAGRDYVVTGSGQVVWMPLFVRMPTPYHQRELSIVLRDRRTGAVVYESRAAHDGPWPDRPAFWAALVEAALDGFPEPPSGGRRVVTEVPR